MIDINNETQAFICFNSSCKNKEYVVAIEYKLSVNKKIGHCIYYSICHSKFSIILIYQMRNRNCNFATHKIVITLFAFINYLIILETSCVTII